MLAGTVRIRRATPSVYGSVLFVRKVLLLASCPGGSPPRPVRVHLVGLATVGQLSQASPTYRRGSGARSPSNLLR
jgi:hypothetical protein